MSTQTRINWTNLIFIATAHLLAVGAVLYMALVHFSWWTLALGFVWYVLGGLAITGGYHRFYSHPTYKAAWPVRWLWLLFGAAGVQNSALKWSIDHRVHHTYTDQVQDPYNIEKGFWWAHILWIFYADPSRDQGQYPDLTRDKELQFQHKYYLPLAILVGLVIPTALGFLWGDPIGAALTGGFLRLVVQWHATFFVNSLAHMLGSQPYSTENSARDSMVTALVSFGEGYHNFHHRFQSDYRNGIRWFHFDPTKWVVWTFSKLGLAWDLKKVPDYMIERAKEGVREQGRGAGADALAAAQAYASTPLSASTPSA